MKLFVTCTQERHALIIFDGARVGGGGGRHVTHSSHNSTYVYFIVFLFIWNIPKRINYITKYLNCHLNRLC